MVGFVFNSVIQNGGKPQCPISVLKNDMEGRGGRVLVCLGLGETLWRCLLERCLFPSRVAAALGLLQLNRGSEAPREDPLSPGQLVS